MYYSSCYIDEFYDRITKEAKKITDDYEIIFVDDGSLYEKIKIGGKVHFHHLTLKLQTNDNVIYDIKSLLNKDIVDGRL